MSRAGELLKMARETAGIQQKDLAAAMGIQASRLSRIESGAAEPDSEELMRILAAINTQESAALAEDLAYTPKHIVTPHWHDLTPTERETLRNADRSLDTLLTHRTSPAFPKTLLHYANELEEKLSAGIKYLTLVDHKMVFIGPVGVGKSTGINRLFGLMLPSNKSKGGKVRDSGKFLAGLLPTGSGRITAFEYRIAYGPKTRILVEPESEAVIRRDVRSLCVYWLAEAGGGEKPTRPLPEELERVYRNMTGLAESAAEIDPVKKLITPEVKETDDLFSIVLQNMNLSARKKTELVFDADDERDPAQDEMEWIRKRLRQINLGRLPEFSLPRGVTLVLNNPRLRSGGYNLTVVDTRGIDETASREDLDAAAADPYALCVLCSGFRDAPTQRVLNQIERAKNRRFETVEKKRFTILVLPQGMDATQLPDDEDDDPIDEEDGYRRRKRHVEKALGSDADHINVLLFNSETNDADATLASLRSRIGVIRELARNELADACESVDTLITQQEKVQLEQCQRQVREKFEWFLKNSRILDDPMTPIHLRLLDEVMQCHASSIYSATRYAGVGRSVSLYHIFNMQVRECADAMAVPAISGLKTLLHELRDRSEVKRPDMKQSRTYLADLLGTVDRKLKAFVEKSETIGDTIFRPFFENDEELWSKCLKQWGQGQGYRDRVVHVINDWFVEHRDVVRRVEREIQKAWDSEFLAWVREVIGQP